MLDSLMKEFGLLGEQDLAKEYRFKGTPDTVTTIDRSGKLRVFRLDVRAANDWEAFYTVLWKESVEAVADACDASFRDAVRALKARSPFQARAFW